MDRDNLYQMLEAAMPSQELTQRLRNEYFPEIVDRFNSEDSRRRFGLYQNERIPVNERNLTDVRTRMGVLIEFELARISNELLCSFGINDVFWSYVVANRFPDLEVRRNTGERLCQEHRITYAVVMTEKYKSTVYHYCEGELISVATNQKPKNVINLLNQSEN